MARLLLRDLRPGTHYKVQLRAVAGDSVSEWSRRFNLHVTTDMIPPDVPVWDGEGWVVNGETFVATWLPLDMELEHNMDFHHYEVRLSDGATTKIVKTDNTYYELTRARNRNFFGTAKTTVTARVRSVDIAGNKSEWNSLKTATAGVPDAPTDAVVEETTDGLKISWTPPANTSNVEGYRVYISTSGPNFTPSLSNRIYEGEAASCTYNTGTYAVHYIKIRSYSYWGLESADLTAQGTPKSPFVLDTNPPSVPGSLSVVIDRSGAVARALVSWTFDASGDDADIQNFAIRYRKTGDTNWFMEFASNDVRSLYVDLPQPYANYQFQIASMDLTGNYSEWSDITTLSSGIPGPPPQTTGLVVVPGFGDLSISWTQSTHDDVTYGGYYEIQVAKDSSFSTNLLTYKTGNLNIAVAGLALFTTYYVRVRAVDVDGNAGSWSSIWTGQTEGIEEYVPTDLLPPSSSPNAVVSAGIGTIFISWSPISNPDLVKYEVHMGTSSSFTPSSSTKVAETPGTIITITKDASGAALSYSTTYYFKIIAKDADGSGPIGAVSSGVSPRKADSSDIVTIVADQIATGSLGAAIITLASGGRIQSSGYIADTQGFMLSDTAVDIQTGKVNFGTLRAGTMTASNLRIGANGQIIVDSTGEIKSNNYNGSVGWRLGSTGLDAPGLTINAGNVYGDTIAGRALTVNSGGYIRSSSYSAPTSPNYNNGAGFNLDYNGLQVYGGNIYGPTVITNHLYSATHDANSPLSVSRPGGGGTYNPSFGINSAGKAVFSSALIYGQTVVGSGGIQSSDYSPGSEGWKISATGGLEMNTGTFRGTMAGSIITGSYSITGQWLSGATREYTGRRVAISTDGNLYFQDSNGSSSYMYRDASTEAIQLIGDFRCYTLDTGAISMGGGNISMGGGNISMGQGNITSLGSIGGGTSAINLNSNMNVGGQTLTGGLTFSGGLSGTGTVTFGTLTGSGSRSVVANASGVISAPSSSLRYKENVRPLRKFERILDLDPIVYQYKDRAGYGDRLYAGFAAEQLDEVGLGIYVDYDNQGRPDNVRYSDMITGVVELIKEFKNEIAELKNTVNSLQGRA